MKKAGPPLHFKSTDTNRWRILDKVKDSVSFFWCDNIYETAWFGSCKNMDNSKFQRIVSDLYTKDWVKEWIRLHECEVNVFHAWCQLQYAVYQSPSKKYYGKEIE